jgi:hypothetical protein
MVAEIVANRSSTWARKRGHVCEPSPIAVSQRHPADRLHEMEDFGGAHLLSVSEGSDLADCAHSRRCGREQTRDRAWSPQCQVAQAPSPAPPDIVTTAKLLAA